MHVFPSVHTISMSRIETIVRQMFQRRGIPDPSPEAVHHEISIFQAHLRLKHSHHMSLYTQEEIEDLKKNKSDKENAIMRRG